MDFPPQTPPVCCRCGCELPDGGVRITDAEQVKEVCSKCATPAEKGEGKPKREESK